MTKKKPARRSKRILLAVGVLAGVLLLVVALLPTLLSKGLGRGRIASAIGSQLHGTVAIDALEVGWFGTQSVHGFSITDEAGVEAVRLDVTANVGLLALATGQVERLAIEISGKLDGRVREDGSTSFGDLIASSPRPKSAPDQKTPKTPREPAPGARNALLGGLPALDVTLAGLSVTLALPDATGARTLALDDVRGRLEYVPGGACGLELTTATTADGVTGSIDVRATADGLFDERGALQPGGTTIKADVTILSVPVPIGDAVQLLEKFAISATTDDLSESLAVGMQLSVDGADAPGDTLRVALTLDAPVTDDGRIAVGLDTISGEVTGSQVPTSLLQPFLADTPIVLARDVGPTCDVNAKFGGGETKDVTITLSSEGFTLDLAARVGGDGAVEGSRLVARATIDPDLAGGAIETPAPVNLTMRSWSIPPRSADGALPIEGIAFDAQVTVGTLRLPLGEGEPLVVGATSIDLRSDALGDGVAVSGQATVTSAELREPVTIMGTGLAVRFEPDAERLTATGGARIVTAGEEPRDLGRFECDLAIEQNREGPVPTGTLTLAGLDLAAVESLLGREPETLTGWLGDAGDVTVALAPPGESWVSVESAMPRLTGTFRAELVDEVVRVTADELTLTVGRQVLEAMLNQAPDGEKSGEDETPPAVAAISVPADVPFTLAIESLHVPLAMISGEAFDAALVDIRATLRGGPLRLADADGDLSTIDALTVTVEAHDLAKGLAFEIGGSATGRGAPEPGSLRAEGSVVNLIAEDGTLRTDAARINMVGSADGVATTIADTLLALEQLLVAAVGPSMSATFDAKDFSHHGGSLDGRIETTNGFMAGRVRGHEGDLLTSSDNQFHGELEITPPLREHILAPIHPILADVRTTEQPLRFRLTSDATIPGDGDVARLNADLEITIGAVEFDSGSLVLGILQLFEGSEGRSTIPGSIDPIIVQIRDGVITYRQFTVHVGKYALRYAGTVDLVKKRIDLRTEIPLDALGRSFSELEDYVEGIVVPIVTRGTFDKNKTEIDPDFDLAAMLAKSGLRGLLDDLIKKNTDEDEDDDTLGNILGNIFKKKKKDK